MEVSSQGLQALQAAHLFPNQRFSKSLANQLLLRYELIPASLPNLCGHLYKD